ncbi:MAG: 4-alpha-glucanotransferase [Opitutales bacterium]|nr:4-alpha-glucanotransferase [Opitutales bacterium]
MSKPLNQWLTTRSAGVLLHPTSLPAEFGIGDLGKTSRTFVDFLTSARFSYWQMCPLGPTGFGDSPYQSFSAFAGNPYLIDPTELVELDLLPQEELSRLLFLPSDYVDYGQLHEKKWPLLFAAYKNWKANPGPTRERLGSFNDFRSGHQHWIEDYGLFQSLKDHFEGKPWYEWPEKARKIEKARAFIEEKEIAERTEAYIFFQYLFFHQWSALKTYGNERGVEIIGDIPIFVSRDSADVWSNPDLFLLDRKSLKPLEVAGCPPDYFSETGQFWGNPVYDWERAGEDLLEWWKKRFALNYTLYDVVRIDHFRGLESYWSIPADSPDASYGRWIPGPGKAFFEAMQDAHPEGKIIAEDLGTITPEVRELLADTGLPGMAVLQFAFGDESDNLYLPHQHVPNQVVYTGTHDNDTTRGWYEKAPEKCRDHVRRYLRVSGDEIAWDFIRTAYRSVCRLAIVPFPDLLSLDSSGRLNTPGTSEGNWQWRFAHHELEKLAAESADYLRELAELYNR